MLLHTNPVTHTQALRNRILIQAPAFTQRLSHTEALTHSNNIHTHTHTDAFCTQTAFPYVQMLVHRYFHIRTQARLHAEACTHRLFHTQALLHTEASTHTHTQTHTHTHYDCCRGRFYTRKLGHTHTHPKKIHPENLSCRSFYMQMLLHTESFSTQTHLHEGAFTHRCFYAECSCTQMGSHTFTHRCLETQAPLHIEALHTDRFTQRTPLHTLLIE